MTETLKTNSSNLASRSEQEKLKEEIAQLRKEWEDLCSKDDLVKHHIDVVRQKIGEQRRSHLQ
ncbi:hypothetical protein BC940DRAFT_314157 [Gongronella butleri]|nr:hypothetical protein BC940DRAFT_314157 [Gongronella butleri]